MSPPFVSDVGEMLDYFADHDSATAEQIEAAGVILGRNSYPALVSDLHRESLLSPEAAAIVVPSAWSSVEFPNRALGDDECFVEVVGGLVYFQPVRRIIPPRPCVRRTHTLRASSRSSTTYLPGLVRHSP